MLRYRIYAFSIAFLLSCGGSDDLSGYDAVVKLDLDSPDGEVFSDAFDGLDYLFLDYSDSLPLVMPYNFVFTDSSVAVRDATMNNLFFFDRDGQVNRVIIPSGRGPNEYIQMDGFQLTPDRIFIQDAYLKKILELDHSGTVVREHSNYFNNTDFYAGEDYFIYFMGHNPDFGGYNFIRKDRDTDQSTGFDPIRGHLENIRRFNAYNSFTEDYFRDTVSLLLPYTTEVVLIRKSTGEPAGHVFFDVGKYRLRESDVDWELGNRTQVIEQKNLVGEIKIFMPTGFGYFAYLRRG